MTDFEKMVKAMRKAQKEYFANRTPAMLQEAKRLEYEVDKALAAAETRDDNMTFDFMKENQRR